MKTLRFKQFIYSLLGIPRPNWLLHSAGLPVFNHGDVDQDVEATVVGLLSEYAARMVQGGVIISPDQWDALGQMERAALISAGNQEKIKQALRIGGAGQGAIGRAKVLAEIDDGDELEDAILESWVSGLHNQKTEERIKNAR